MYASQTAFANECFVDELAHAAGRDPLEFRQALLAGKPRYLAVLKLVAEKAGWGRKTPGRGMGLAIHHFFSDAIVAEVAEVSVSRGEVRVHRVVCAVDCGTVVHPDGVAAQIEGGVVYGLSAALKGQITVEEVPGIAAKQGGQTVAHNPEPSGPKIPARYATTGNGLSFEVFAGTQVNDLPLTP